MGNYAVFLVIAFAMVSAVLVVHMYSATDDTDEALNQYYHEELARDAAVTGLNMTVRKLAADGAESSWNDNPTQYELDATPHANGATFEVTVEPCIPTAGPPPDDCAGISDPGDIIDVTAIGTSGIRYNAETDTYDPITVTIQARYRRAKDEGLPPAFRQALTANTYNQSQGNVGLFSSNEEFNASAHVNGDIDLDGASMYVEGYVTYTDPEPPASPGLDPGLYDFLPNIDYNEGDPNLFWNDDIVVPQLDFGTLATAAITGGSHIVLGGSSMTIYSDAPYTTLDFTNPGSLPWNDTYPSACISACGTKENPYIVAIEGGIGAVTFKGKFIIKGYAVIASPQDMGFAIVPHDECPTCFGLHGDLNEDGESQVLLATPGDIFVGVEPGGNACLGTGPSQLNENALISGEIVLNAGPSRNNDYCTSGSGFEDGISLYAGPGGTINFQGDPYLVGGLVAGNVTFNGYSSDTPTLSYAPPAQTIIDPGFDYDKPIGPVLISYSEWGTGQVETP